MTNTIIQGHVLAELKRISDASVHCCVTSPPYWGLRDYGLEPVVWGGEAGCEHVWGDEVRAPTKNATQGSTETIKWPSMQEKNNSPVAGQFCQRCQAWRGQLGLEPDLHLYVQHLVEIFREVRRVLHPSGVCFLNLGDSYAAQSQGKQGTGDRYRRTTSGKLMPPQGRAPVSDNLKPKDLCGIPWRTALALQADGWYLRSDIIWAKTSAMPESVRDRPTKAHEYIFLLTKEGRYFWDQEAVREGGNPESETRYKYAFSGRDGLIMPNGDIQRIAPKGIREFRNGRNIRTVWTINPQPFAGAHFATFPPKLVERCILAGSSPRGVCPDCGAPWERVVERESNFPTNNREGHPNRYGHTKTMSAKGFGMPSIKINTLTTGWRPTCACPPAEPVPAVILDPFLGSGTTAAVAKSLGRNWVGIELNPEYIEMAWKRINGAQPALIPAGVEGAPKPVARQAELL